MTDLLMECEEEELEPWQRVDQGDTFPVMENKPTDAITPASNPMKFAIAPAGLQMPPDIPTPLMFAPSLSGPQSTSSFQATTSNYALPIKSTGVFTVPSTATVVPFNSGVSVFPINCGQLQKTTKVSSTHQTTPSFVFASQVSINQNHPTQTRKHFQMLDKSYVVNNMPQVGTSGARLPIFISLQSPNGTPIRLQQNTPTILQLPASLLRQTAPGQMSSRVAFVGQCGQPMPIRFQMPQAAQVPVQAIEATAITDVTAAQVKQSTQSESSKTGGVQNPSAPLSTGLSTTLQSAVGQELTKIIPVKNEIEVPITQSATVTPPGNRARKRLVDAPDEEQPEAKQAKEFMSRTTPLGTEPLNLSNTTPVKDLQEMQNESESPKKCPRCGVTFAVFASLKRHARQCCPNLNYQIVQNPLLRVGSTVATSVPAVTTLATVQAGNLGKTSPAVTRNPVTITSPEVLTQNRILKPLLLSHTSSLTQPLPPLPPPPPPPPPPQPSLPTISADGKLIMLVDDFYYGRMEGNPQLMKEEARAVKNISFRCNSCQKVLKTNIRFMNHMRHHMELERRSTESWDTHTTCQHCFRHFATPYHLQCHVESAHTNGLSTITTRCKICELNYDSEQLLLQHMKDHHKPGEMPYACEVCGFRSSFYTDVDAHFRNVHETTKNLQCPFCLKVLRTVSYYQQHYMRHQKKSVHRCSKCRLNFLNMSSKTEHKAADHKTHKKPSMLEGLLPGTKVILRVSLFNGHQARITTEMPTPVDTQVAARKPKSVPPQTQTSKVMVERPKTSGHMCMECTMEVKNFANHFPTYVHCSLCRYSTSCSRSFAEHMISVHTSRKPRFSMYKQFCWKAWNLTTKCSCGLQQSWLTIDSMASHLALNPTHYCTACPLSDGSHLSSRAPAVASIEQKSQGDVIVIDSDEISKELTQSTRESPEMQKDQNLPVEEPAKAENAVEEKYDVPTTGASTSIGGDIIMVESDSDNELETIVNKVKQELLHHSSSDEMDHDGSPPNASKLPLSLGFLHHKEVEDKAEASSNKVVSKPDAPDMCDKTVEEEKYENVLQSTPSQNEGNESGMKQSKDDLCSTEATMNFNDVDLSSKKLGTSCNDSEKTTASGIEKTDSQDASDEQQVEDNTEEEDIGNVDKSFKKASKKVNTEDMKKSSEKGSGNEKEKDEDSDGDSKEKLEESNEQDVMKLESDEEDIEIQLEESTVEVDKLQDSNGENDISEGKNIEEKNKTFEEHKVEKPLVEEAGNDRSSEDGQSKAEEIFPKVIEVPGAVSDKDEDLSGMSDAHLEPLTPSLILEQEARRMISDDVQSFPPKRSPTDSDSSSHPSSPGKEEDVLAQKQAPHNWTPVLPITDTL